MLATHGTSHCSHLEARDQTYTLVPRSESPGRSWIVTRGEDWYGNSGP